MLNNKKKELEAIIKEAISSVKFDRFSVRWKSDSFVYFDKDKEVGSIGFPFVSDKHSGYGSLFGVYVIGVVNGGNIAPLVKNIKLSYPPRNLPKQIFYRSSLEYTASQKLPKNGVLPIGQNDDLNNKCKTLMDYAKHEILRDIELCLSNSPDLSERIFLNHSWFYYPSVQIIYNVMTNSTMPEEALIDKLKRSKIYGSNQKQIEEALQAVKQYLGHAV